MMAGASLHAANRRLHTAHGASALLFLFLRLQVMKMIPGFNKASGAGGIPSGSGLFGSLLQDSVCVVGAGALCVGPGRGRGGVLPVLGSSRGGGGVGSSAQCLLVPAHVRPFGAPRTHARHAHLEGLPCAVPLLSPQMTERQLYEAEKKFKMYEDMISAMEPEVRTRVRGRGGGWRGGGQEAGRAGKGVAGTAPPRQRLRPFPRSPALTNVWHLSLLSSSSYSAFLAHAPLLPNPQTPKAQTLNQCIQGLGFQALGLGAMIACCNALSGTML